MIRYIDIKQNGYADKQYVEIAGLSTDTKQDDNYITGSLFLEVDTGKVYVFDEVSGNWTEIGG